MPLSRISRREPSALGAFTYRELLSQRRLAQRAVRRGRDGAQALFQAIEDELALRRARKLERLGAAVD